MTTDAKIKPACPECGVPGRAVEQRTVENLLVEAANPARDPTANYRFCKTQGCEVVYYSEQPEQVFHLHEVRVRVGQKKPGPPTPVCYCFDHTAEEIEEEIRQTGASDIPDSIAAKVKAGECACEVKNPEGVCCLGNVRTVAKGAMESSAPEGQVSHAKNLAFWSQGGLLVSAVLASACCWLPLALIGFGGTAVGVSAFFEEYRVLFVGLTVALLGAAWYFTYRPARDARQGGEACEASGETCCPVDDSGRLSKVNRLNRILLWPITAVALAFLFFPNYIGALVGGGESQIGDAQAVQLWVRPNPGNELRAEDLDSLSAELLREGFAVVAEVLPGQVGLRLELGAGQGDEAAAQLQEWLAERERSMEVVPLHAEQFRVGGMTCAACAARVTDALWSVAGIAGVSLNEETGEAIVLAESSPEILGQALEAVRSAGYEIELPSGGEIGSDLGGLGCCTIEEPKP